VTAAPPSAADRIAQHGWDRPVPPVLRLPAGWIVTGDSPSGTVIHPRAPQFTVRHPRCVETSRSVRRGCA